MTPPPPPPAGFCQRNAGPAARIVTAGGVRDLGRSGAGNMTLPQPAVVASSPSSSSSSSSRAVSAQSLPLPKPSSPRAGSRRWKRRPQPIGRWPKSASSDLVPGLETPPRPSPTAQRASPTRSCPSPTAQRASPTRSRPSPTAQRASPTRSRPSPTAQRASPTRYRPSPTAQRASPARSRRSRPSPKGWRSSPTRSRPSPKGRRSSPIRLRHHRSVRIRFSRRQLKKHHSFMLCKYDKKRAISLSSFIKDKQMVRFMFAYGIKPSCDTKGSHRLTRLAQEIIRGLTTLVLQILESGYSLGGQLSIKRLYILPATKEIKLVAFRKGGLCKKNNRRAEKDWDSLEDIIRHKILKGQTIPSDLQKFLKLLKVDANSHQDLIRNNLCHMDDISKILYYKWMYEELRQIKRHNPTLYYLALAYIKSGQLKWLAEICGSIILEGVLNYRDPNVFTPDAEGLTLYGRHSTHHIMDYSIGDDGSILFTQAEMFNMMEMFLPGFFSEMQEALYAIKKLETPCAPKDIPNSISEGVFSLATPMPKDQKEDVMSP